MLIITKVQKLPVQEYMIYYILAGLIGLLPALLLATPDATHGWRYAGRVGSGFSDAQLKALGAELHLWSAPGSGTHSSGVLM